MVPTHTSACRLTGAVGAVLLTLLSGCGEPQATFDYNQVYVRAQELKTGETYVAQQKQAIVNAVSALFGTPDKPFMPQVDGLNDVLDMDRVAAAAGPVNSDQYGTGEGLYRQHCVHCHGVTGNGRGPTAPFLNPYPRDFTKGTFKFKSTPIGFKPTDDDLRRVLTKGINGTAMPSFKLLSEGEIDALIDYVKYLSIRGETERMLIELNPDFYDPEDAQANEQLLQEFHSPEFLVNEVLTDIVSRWSDAEDNVTEVEPRPAVYDRYSEQFDLSELLASQERGRKLYYTSVANCFSCHGPSQLGDGQLTDYDQWTKEFFDWTNKNAEAYDERFNEYLSLNEMEPRIIRPRNLREGIYRGGRRPIDIFWRIINGIDGTPMPAANRAALSEDDIWDLVNYVLSLPFEPASRPGVEIATNKQQVN